MRTQKARIYVETGDRKDGPASWTPAGVCEMTESETATLRSRIVKYMNSCRERRAEEQKVREASVRLAGKTCVHCNGARVVRKKSWNIATCRWEFVKGEKMPCPNCLEGAAP